MWFLNDLGRLTREKAAVQGLEESNEWLDGVHWCLDGPELTIDAEIVFGDDQRYAIRLRFPDLYPSVPPSVRPREPERWSDHQYGATGDLCLELGPDNWHPDAHTAADMFQSTLRLLTLEAEHAADSAVEIPSRHQLTDGQEQRSQLFRWVVTPAVNDALNAIPDGSAVRCEMYVMYHNQAITLFLKRIEIPGEEDWIDASVPEELKRLGRRGMGGAIGGTQGLLSMAAMGDPGEIVDLLSGSGVPEPKDENDEADLDNIEFIIVKGWGGNWQASMIWSDREKVTAFSTLNAEVAPRDVRTGYDQKVLGNVKVAVVGLGSAGSKIATSLARTGVEHFALIDDDLLHPGNLVRHDGDWFQIGQHKVDAVADRLMMINPDATIVRRRHRLSGQESTTSAASALTAIGQADVIVDATANPEVFSLCAHVARQSKKALVWMEIYAGGIGGLVARARPDKDVEPFTLREAINAAGTEIATAQDVEPPEGVVDYGAVDAEDNVVIASDADVTTITGMTTQIVLDTLLNREPSHYPYPAYFVGLSRGWIFEQPFHTIPIECTAKVDWSTVVPVDKATQTEAAEFIVQLIEEQSASAETTSPE